MRPSKINIWYGFSGDAHVVDTTQVMDELLRTYRSKSIMSERVSDEPKIPLRLAGDYWEKADMTAVIDRISGTGPDDWGLDEIVATNVNVHIERMDRDNFWMAIYAGDRMVTIWLEARKNTLYARVEEDQP